MRKLGSLVCVSYLQGQELTAEDAQLRGTHGHSLVSNLCFQQYAPQGGGGGVTVSLSRTWVEWAEGPP